MEDEFEVDDLKSEVPQSVIDAYMNGDITQEDMLEIMNDLDMSYAPSMDQVMMLSNSCVLPILTQMMELFFPILILCFTHRIIANLLQRNDHGVRFNHGDSASITNILQEGNIADNLLEIVDCSLGFLGLYHIFGPESIVLVSYAMFSLAILMITREHGYSVGFPIVGFTISFLLFSELVLVPSKEWHKIRGAQMIMAMKVISLGFDLDRGMVPLTPDFWAFTSYVLHVGNLVFGPWFSYKDHQMRMTSPVSIMDFVLLTKILKNIFCMCFCLILSTCVITWIISDNNDKWVLAYRDAQSFRFSHYFVCYASQLTAVLTTFSTPNTEVSVSQPLHIEFPRSLVEVVTFWNLPMHNWLKTYIFKNARPYGSFVAILCTYLASSMLHGLNFQLSAVLVSLGFYTYVEYVFRNKLSIAFNACLQARPCKPDCPHLYSHVNPIVFSINLMFSALAIFHLAYLGVMFDTSEQSQQGYTMSHTLSKWSNLSYASHIVALVMFLFNLLI